jgi:hypothetical protein
LAVFVLVRFTIFFLDVVMAVWWFDFYGAQHQQEFLSSAGMFLKQVEIQERERAI